VTGWNIISGKLISQNIVTYVAIVVVQSNDGGNVNGNL